MHKIVIQSHLISLLLFYFGLSQLSIESLWMISINTQYDSRK